MRASLLALTLAACAVAAYGQADIAATGATGSAADSMGANAPVDTSNADAALTTAQQTVESIRTKGADYMKQEQTLCAQEVDSINEWKQVIDSNAGDRAKEKAERMAQKKALFAAVGKRLGTLKKFLAVLKGIREQLGSHIARTNKLFTAVYDVNANDVAGAADIMRDLGFVVSLPWSPLVTPIKLPKKDSMDAEADAPDGSDPIEKAAESVADTSATGATGAAEPPTAANAAGTEPSEASLMEIESQISAKAMYCKDMVSCKKAYTQAFALYRLGYQHAKQNKAFFERERAALGGFRDGLRELIQSKEDKQKALEEQAAALEAKINGPQPPGLSGLFPLLSKHETIVKRGCSEMKGRSELALKELSDIEDVLSGKGCTQCGSDGSAASSPASDVAAESEQVAAAFLETVSFA